jgi:hypothetical protein
VATINLDETLVRYNPGRYLGHVAVNNRQWFDRAVPVEQDMTTVQSKMGITHVGLICDVPVLNRLLPQVLIIPAQILTLMTWKWLRPQLPDTFRICRQKNKWMTVSIMIWIIRLIHWNLRDYRLAYDLILIMDVYSAHFDPAVIYEAIRCGIKLAFIPALCTWLMQPLNEEINIAIPLQIGHRSQLDDRSVVDFC